MKECLEDAMISWKERVPNLLGGSWPEGRQTAGVGEERVGSPSLMLVVQSEFWLETRISGVALGT